MSDLVPTLEKKFNKFGLSLKKDNETFKSTFEILKDVSTLNITDMEKAGLLEDIAGKRNAQVIAAIISNMRTAIDVSESFAESQGSALIEHRKYMEGVEAAQSRVSASMTELHTKLLDDDTIVNVLNLTSSLIDNISAMGKFSIILAGATLALGIFSLANRKAVKDMTDFQVVSTIGGIKKFGSDVLLAGKMLLGFDTGLKGATISATALNVATGALLLGIPLIAQGIGTLINHNKRLKEEIQESVQAFKEQQQVSSSLDGLVLSYENLANQSSLTAEEQEKLLKIKEQIKQLLPESTTYLDNENLSLQEQLDIVRKLNNEEKERLKNEAHKQLSRGSRAYEDEKKELEELINRQEEWYRLQKELSSKYLDGSITQDELSQYKYISDELPNLTERINALTDSTIAYETAEKIVNGTLKENIKITNENTDANNSNADSRYKQTKSIEELNKSLSQSLNKARSEISDINEALHSYNENNKFTQSQLSKLIEKYPQLLSVMHDEKKLYEELKKIQNEKVKEATDNFNKELTALEKSINGKIDSYELDVRNWHNAEEAKLKITEDVLGKVSKLYSKFVNEGLNEQDAELMANKWKKVLVGDLKEVIPEVESYFNFKKIDVGKFITSVDGKDGYSAEADRYALINQQLDKNNVLLEKNRTLQALAGDDLAKKIPLMEEEIRLNEERKRVLHDLNNEQRKEMQELEKTLSGQGFKFAGAGDNRIITNLDQIKGKTKEVEEQFKRYMDLQSKLIPKVSQDWMDLSSAIQKTGLSLQDAIRNSTKELIELEKRNAYMDLELRQRVAQKQLDESKSKMEEEVSEIQGWIDRLQSEIDDIQESERARQENLERSRRQEEISKLQNKYYYLQYVNLANITEAQAKLVGLEKEREQYLERQVKLQELQIKLENIRNEKNIQQLTKLQDGSFDFTYVADEREIDNINKQIEDLQTEHNKSLKDLKDRTLEDLKKAQESYDEWEYQNDIRRQIETKQRRIKNYQDEIKDLQDKYTELERLTNEAFAREKENLDRYYMDMDMLTDSAMKNLHDTFGENWVNIYDTLTGFFGQIASEYDALVKKLSTPLPTPTYSAGGQGFYTPSSGGTGFNDSLATVGNGFSANWSDMYMQARERGDYKAMELANRQANIERGIGDIITATTDINEIKKKYGFATGGETQRTGWHWVDGKIGEPERILSGSQTKDFNKLVEGMPDLLKAVNITKNLFSNIKVPSIPNIQPAVVGSGETVYYINELTVPTNDFDSFIRDFTNVVTNHPNKTIMKVKKIGRI